MIAVAIINYKTAAATLACIESLQAQSGQSKHIHLLDNGSGEAEAESLRSYASSRAASLSFTASPTNLGFAGGMNVLFRSALADPNVEHVLLLNSDTRPTPGFLDAMIAALDSSQRVEMVAARLLHPADQTTESIGIALYRSTLASNRKNEDDILLGPTGGCALLTRRLLEDVEKTYGYWFDEQFFCYAEDTDLVIRARWLGYVPAFAASATVYHAGSLSSGGPDNEFVLYHGIRNSLWWLVKDAPLGWLLRSIPWFVALHCGIVLRHVRRGRARVVWRLYRDALKGVPSMLRKRRVVSAARRVPRDEFARWVTPRFYERDYVRSAWRELWSKRRDR